MSTSLNWHQRSRVLVRSVFHLEQILLIRPCMHKKLFLRPQSLFGKVKSSECCLFDRFWSCHADVGQCVGVDTLHFLALSRIHRLVILSGLWKCYSESIYASGYAEILSTICLTICPRLQQSPSHTMNTLHDDATLWSSQVQKRFRCLSYS